MRAQPPQSDPLLVRNAHLVTPHESIDPGWLLVENGRVAGLGEGPGPHDTPAGADVLDAHGNYVVPGLIDTHVCGMLGFDCRQGTDAFDVIAPGLPAFGVTGFLATIIGTSVETAAPLLADAEKVRARREPEARLLGVHLEGPYLGKKYRGLTLEEELGLPSVQRDRAIYERFPRLVKMMTVAPELPGCLDYIKYLRSLDIVVAIGHTEIETADDLAAAVAAGASHVTHIFNAMQVRTLKEPGVDAPGFADLAIINDNLSVSLIADGVHVCPDLIDLLLRAKPHGQIVLVTDCFLATGMLPGAYTYPDGVEVTVDGTCHRRTSDRGLAGSVLTLNRAVRNVMSWTGLPATEVLPMATRNPARLIGVHDRKGDLRPGMDADVAAFDRDWNAQWTMVGGRIVFQADGARS